MDCKQMLDNHDNVAARNKIFIQGGPKITERSIQSDNKGLCSNQQLISITLLDIEHLFPMSNNDTKIIKFGWKLVHYYETRYVMPLSFSLLR